MSRQLSLDDLLEHVDRGGVLGITPASVGAVVVDVDDGDPDRLVANFPPRAIYQTPRGGVHAFYQHDGPAVRQHRWVAPVFRTSGDLRHAAGGYVVLWEPERLIDCLSRDTYAVPFADVSQALVVRREPRTGPQPPVDGQDAAADGSTAGRHDYVKRMLVQARVDGMDGAALRRYAVQLQAGLPQPPEAPHIFALSEALRIAEWAASRRWDTATQRERGIRSGQARRARNADRDAEILSLLQAGHSQRKVGAELGVSRRVVRRVQDRLKGYPTPQD